MKKHLIPICLLLTSAGATNAYAQSPVQMSIGANIQPANWEGDNKNGGTSFDAKGGQLRLDLRLSKARFYSGLSFQGGEFDFDDGAPDKIFNAAPAERLDKVTIERGEFDWVFGYYFWPQVSLFVDLKSITNDWKGERYSVNYTGLGVGVTGFNPINEHWILFGSLGFVKLNIESSGDEIGDGRGSAFQIGGLYKINDKANITISLKTQHNVYEFDDNSEQEHDIGGLVFGFNVTP